MKAKAVILAGGVGSRLSLLTEKRTKPAVPFAGKYRIIDFTLSNCVNSGIFDVMVLAQYRPHSLIEHIGAGGPWDLNRDFTGGVRIYTPYQTRGDSGWYLGTADAVQQNFTFIKHNHPDQVLILSGDHIYTMDYDMMRAFHADHQADVTLATIRVPIEEASRFGVVTVGAGYRVTSFVEKPPNPPSNLVNMGVYLFERDVLDRALWQDHQRPNSSHDFGKDILPRLVAEGARVFAFPYTGYWVDVGTVEAYWQAHMDLLQPAPPLQLYNRDWVIHTRTEERPPARIATNATIADSMISDGCLIHANARIERSVLSPGVVVEQGATIKESIILTDTHIGPATRIERAVLDKNVRVGAHARIGAASGPLTLVGKNSILPTDLCMEAGSGLGPDIVPADFTSLHIRSGEIFRTQRKPYEI